MDAKKQWLLTLIFLYITFDVSISYINAIYALRNSYQQKIGIITSNKNFTRQRFTRLYLNFFILRLYYFNFIAFISSF